MILNLTISSLLIPADLLQ